MCIQASQWRTKISDVADATSIEMTKPKPRFMNSSVFVEEKKIYKLIWHTRGNMIKGLADFEISLFLFF